MATTIEVKMKVRALFEGTMKGRPFGERPARPLSPVEVAIDIGATQGDSTFRNQVRQVLHELAREGYLVVSAHGGEELFELYVKPAKKATRFGPRPPTLPGADLPHRVRRGVAP